MESLSAAVRNRRGLQITFGLTFFYFIVEAVGGLLTNSLALFADAAHMLTDVGGLGLALFATWISQKPATPEKTYRVLEQLEMVLKTKFGIDHSTIQIEHYSRRHMEMQH
jgi:Co/Zn/Cd efflux system component